MNIEDRVYDLIKGKNYKEMDIDINDNEENIIRKSLYQFKDNINVNINKFSSMMEANRISLLIKKDNFTELTARECRTICEALYDILFEKGYFEEENNVTDNEELKNINALFNKMQQYANYDFLKQLNKCKRNKVNKRESQAGGGGLEMLINGYEH